MFPTNRPVTYSCSPDLFGVRLLPSLLAGFAGATFPRFQRYYEGAKTAWPPSRPLAVRSRRDTSVDPADSLAPASGSPQLRQDVVQPVASVSGILSEELPSSPMFPGNPCASARLQRSRPSLRARSLRHVGAAPTAPNMRASAFTKLSGFNRPASTLAVYASCRPRGRRCKTRFGVATTLSPSGLPACACPHADRSPAGFQ